MSKQKKFVNMILHSLSEIRKSKLCSKTLDMYILLM